MNRAFESSASVRFARRVAEGSVVWRVFATLGRAGVGAIHFAAASVGRIDAAFARAGASRPDPDDSRVKAVLVESRLVKWVDAALEVPHRAWASSSARRWLEPIADDVRAQPAAEQVRLVGWMLIVASLTHIVLVLLFSEPVGWPTWVAWAAFLGLSGLCVIAAPGVVAAWANRRPWVRRLLREPKPWP